MPQRLTIVLPSTGAFDSRTWRIASSLTARGHQVTVIARQGEGLAVDETTVAGYRVLRVPVDAIDGLPRPLRSVARRVRGRRALGVRPTAGSTTEPGADTVPAAGAPRAAGTARRAVASAWRFAAIALTTRSQRLATRGVAPPGDLVHAMAYMGIPVGLDIGQRDAARVVYDARDIYVDARTIARLPGPVRHLFARVERHWARRADRVVTVNGPYADVLAVRFGVPRPLVVLNCSLRVQEPAARGRRFHETLGLAGDRRVVLYHGGLSPHRGIEQLLEAMLSIPDATLVLMGYGDLEATIRARSAAADLAGRVAVLPAVPPAQLIEWVASADVAVMPIQPTTLNHRLTTPNKLFEAIAAGVPVVASDLPGMAPIVRETGCGVVVDPTDPAAIATAIREILDGPPERRAAIMDGNARARETYNWEHQVEILIAEYGRLTGRPW